MYCERDSALRHIHAYAYRYHDSSVLNSKWHIGGEIPRVDMLASHLITQTIVAHILLVGFVSLLDHGYGMPVHS